jgi:peptide/nickel transport system substrate-binding protein
VLVVALVGSGCMKAGAADTTVTLVPVTGGSLTVGIDRAPTGCNPNTLAGATWANRFVLSSVLPSAFSVNASGQSIGNQTFIDQAELVSTNPQTVIYTIDPKAVWSDGVPITAADFRYAWEQQRGPEPLAGVAGSIGTSTGTASGTASGTAPVDASVLGYRDIKSLTPSNHGKTVTMVLREPFADWDILFDNLLPAHVMEKVGWDPPCTTVSKAIDLSGGPYELASVSSTRVVLRTNPRWWGTPPLLHRVIIRIASGPTQLAQWFRQGAAGVVQPRAPSAAYVASVVNDPRGSSELDISSSFVQLEFAVDGANTATAVQRDAIAHAIDRQDLTAQLVGSIDANIVPAQSHLYTQNQNSYPNTPDFNSAVNPFVGANQPTTTTTTNATPGSGVPFPTQADLAASAHEMATAGYVQTPDGHWETVAGAPVVLRLAVDEGDPWAAAAGLGIVDQLQRAGFTVQLSTQATAVATGQTLAAGGADLAVLPLDASPYPTQAIAWYTPSLGPAGQNGSQDWSNLDDPTVNNLLTQAERQLYPIKAEQIYAQVDQQLWTDMVGLPLFAEPGVLAWSAGTYGVTPNFHGPNLLGTLDTWQLRLPESASSQSGASSTTSSTSSG